MNKTFDITSCTFEPAISAFKNGCAIIRNKQCKYCSTLVIEHLKCRKYIKLMFQHLIYILFCMSIIVSGLKYANEVYLTSNLKVIQG